MTLSKMFSVPPRLLSVAAVVLGLLAGCGERGSPQPPMVAANGAGAKASASTPCTYVAGRPNTKEAELFAASAGSDTARLKAALDAGGNVNAVDSLKRTPLFAAAFCNRPDAEGMLIEKGSAVDAKDFLGMAPLHAAALVGGVDAAKVLIAKGANINIRNAAGFTPLRLAAATHQLAMVDLLLERGAEVQPHDLDAIDTAPLVAKNEHAIIVAVKGKLQAKREAATHK